MKGSTEVMERFLYLYLYLDNICMSIYICQNLIGLSILLTYTAVWKIQTSSVTF